jgi:iron complex outermembrane receptor protein
MTSSTARSAVASAVAMALGLALAPSAFAQQAQAQAASGASADQLQEVVVTAEKRTSTVQDTAASITAVSAQEIADRGIVDFNSLATSVPGIAMRSAGPGQTEFEMRGLSSAGGNSSMVGFYLDETPLSSPASAQLGKEEIDPTLYDLQRVEVLRGPQGTLYGSSSMGGTVKLVPNPPQLGTFAASGEIDTGYTSDGGSFNQKVNGMINLPIGDTLAVRFVGSEISDSGWIKRIVLADGAPVDTGGYATQNNQRPANFYTFPDIEQINGANSTTIDSARLSLLWKPMDNLTVQPMLMYQLTRQAAPDQIDVNGNPTHPTLPSTLAHWEIYDSPEPQEDKFTLGSLKIEYQAPEFTVTSATAMWGRNTLVSQDSTEENNDAFGFPNYDAGNGTGTSPFGIGPSGPAPNGPSVTEKDYTRQISQELRVTSNGTGPFQWILGYFYQDLYSEWDEWAIAPQAGPAMVAIGLPSTTNLYVDVQPQTIVQNAEFGEASWQFTPDLKGTVGLRHYHYSLSQSNMEYGVFTVNGGLGAPDLPYLTGDSNTASGTDPKFDLSWKATPDTLLYATIAKGFRLGGANQPIPVAAPASCAAPQGPLQGNEVALQAKLNNSCNAALLLQAPSTFSSDSVWSYEVGEKSELLDKHLILNLAAYYERWSNPQLSTNLSGFGITANGADARIYGFEAEMQALLSREWTLGVNFGYTNAQFTADSPITGFPNGYNVPDIPDVTASATLRWKHELTNDLSLMATLEGDYVGTRTDAPYGESITIYPGSPGFVDNYLLHLPAYGFLNARFGFAGNQWTAALYVNNLTNKQALLDPQPQIDLQTNAFVRYLVSRPLTAGLDFTFKF